MTRAHEGARAALGQQREGECESGGRRKEEREEEREEKTKLKKKAKREQNENRSNYLIFANSFFRNFVFGLYILISYLNIHAHICRYVSISTS
jgi:hypothetical protein